MLDLNESPLRQNVQHSGTGYTAHATIGASALERVIGDEQVQFPVRGVKSSLALQRDGCTEQINTTHITQLLTRKLDSRTVKNKMSSVPS